MNMAKQTKAQIAEQDAAREDLRKLFHPEQEGTHDNFIRSQRTVYCVIRSVAKSGMSRTMTLFIIRNGEPLYITRDVCLATGYAYTKEGNLKVNGCGMDMGHDVVYNLSLALFGHDGGRTLTHRWI